jgi:hypothetical protein
MPKRQKPRSRKPAAKRQALKLLGKKRLSPTKRQRRARHAALEKAVGYRIPRLSGVVSKPSRYTVKARQVNYRTEQVSPGHYEGDYWNRRWVPAETKKVATGEKLVVKKLRGKGQIGKGGSGGSRESHRTGTMQARRSAAKAARASGKKGARPKRERKKKKKR